MAQELAYLAELKKKFGKEYSDIIIEEPSLITIPKFKTGSLLLDETLKGGYPKGHITEFFGKEQSGKTTAAIEGAAEFQKEFPNEQILWLDLEKVFDNAYCQSIGLDSSSNFTLVRPVTGEDAYEIMISFVKNTKGGLIVLDSIALMLPSKENEGDMGDSQMGSMARLNSQGMRKYFPHASKSGTTTFLINQVRDKIGISYGSPFTTVGGNAIAFYARTRLQMSSSQGEKDSEGAFISTKCNITTVKATYGREKRKIETSIVYGIGFDNTKELIDLAVLHNIIQKSGSWYSYGETKLGQGEGSVKDLLEDNLELKEEIEVKTNECIK